MKRPCALVLVGLTILVSSRLTTGRKSNENDDMTYNKLTAEEQRVILHKGTERPFSGKYEQHKEAGTYLCKRCDAPLYRSEHKFDSGCGWPAFDDEISGAVKRQPDRHSPFPEIVCAKCGGHLGHVFTGEGFTEKDVRHCVNSVSLSFQSAAADEATKPPAIGDVTQGGPKTERAYFAARCFWGVQHSFASTEGVLSATSGYMGGTPTSRPTGRSAGAGPVMPRRSKFSTTPPWSISKHWPSSSLKCTTLRFRPAGREANTGRPSSTQAKHRRRPLQD